MGKFNKFETVLEISKSFLKEPKTTRDLKDFLIKEFDFTEMYVVMHIIPRLKKNGISIYRSGGYWKAKLNNSPEGISERGIHNE